MRTMSSIAALVLTAMLVAGCSKEPSDSGHAPQSQGTEASSTAAAPTAGNEYQSVQAFWHEFRAAVLSGDRVALLEQVRFPFTTQGSSDSDAVNSYARSGFWDVYGRLMAQDVGLQAEPESVRQYIEAHEEPPPVALGGGRTVPVGDDADEFRAGPLRFEKVAGRWYWASAYEESEE